MLRRDRLTIAYPVPRLSHTRKRRVPLLRMRMPYIMGFDDLMPNTADLDWTGHFPVHSLQLGQLPRQKDTRACPLWSTWLILGLILTVALATLLELGVAIKIRASRRAHESMQGELKGPKDSAKPRFQPGNRSLLRVLPSSHSETLYRLLISVVSTLEFRSIRCRIMQLAKDFLSCQSFAPIRRFGSSSNLTV